MRLNLIFMVEKVVKQRPWFPICIYVIVTFYLMQIGGAYHPPGAISDKVHVDVIISRWTRMLCISRHSVGSSSGICLAISI